MKTIEINSIDSMIKEIREIEQICSKQPIWFRGQSDSTWELLPSIQRENFSKCETYITNEFYMNVNKIESHAPSKMNYSAWMSLMQHYGLPTRILDWSNSPLVAAYFALENYTKYDTDSCIWVLIPTNINRQEGFGNCVYPIDANTVKQMLIPAFKSDASVAEKYKDKIIACNSVEHNLRMYSQQSSFTVHNSQKRLEDICDEKTLFKFIIPLKYKQKLFESINILGISGHYIYPDMEHISKDIVEKYSKKA